MCSLKLCIDGFFFCRWGGGNIGAFKENILTFEFNDFFFENSAPSVGKFFKKTISYFT